MNRSPLQHVDIVLVQPQHSGNIGATARAIANHGLGRLFLVDPPSFDPVCARWMAPHAHDVINRAGIVPNLIQATHSSTFVVGATARTRKWTIPTLSIEELCEEALKRTACSIVFGPEDSGLSNRDLQQCHAMVSLPTYEHQSLNLSQAVGAFGTHLAKAVSAPPTPKQHNIDVLNQQRFVDSAMRVLDSIQYFNGRDPGRIGNFILRLIERGQVTNEELATLTSMGNKIFHSIRVLKQPPAAKRPPP